jgi:excisionase family DNA binding protein
MKSPETETESRLLSVSAVAKLLGVSQRHVHRLADAGRMPPPLRLGGARRWDRVVLDRWVSDGCPATPAKRRAEQ